MMTMMTARRNAMVVHFTLVAAMLAVAAWAWGQLPGDAQIPTHWNASGEIDGTSSKPFGLLFAPALSLGMLVLFAVIPAVEPRRRHLEDSAQAYAVAWLGTALLLALMHVGIVAAGLGYDLPMARFMPTLIGLLFLSLAWALPHMQSTFMMGIRTPWTLSSEYSWRRTHEAGRVVFGLAGVAMLASGIFAFTERAFLAVIGGAVAASLLLVGYSYLMWRQDPERLARTAS